MNDSGLGAQWRVVAAPAAMGSAIAVIELVGENTGDIDVAARSLGLGEIRVGAYRLKQFADVDTGIAARWSERSLHLMPHGGPALMRRLCQWLRDAGISEANQLPTWSDVVQAHPEARSEVEAATLWCMSAAASPGAVDVLLRQSELWKGRDPRGLRAHDKRFRDRVLHRLIEPATVLLVGAANVGKSCLLNALTGRTVSIVSDVAGTTRDHVGILTVCEDVTIRLIDTPGLRQTQDAVEAQAQKIAAKLWNQADLVLWCGDAAHGFCDIGDLTRDTARVLRVGTRRDLGTTSEPVDCSVSSVTGEGVRELRFQIAERLVPRSVRQAPVPWRFWAGLIADQD
ncbi:MAG: 50S ribosome-binding GTPase [Planctomycetes bacterium]|nr:50S ribosome-binding GTPase [Planctomycetota bacterium]